MEKAVAFTIGPLQVHWYAIMIVCGMVLGMLLCYSLARRKGFTADDLMDFALVLIPLGIICARIYYVLFNWGYYSAHPEHIIAIWRGGMAIHGGILGGLLGLLLVCWYKGHSARLWADAMAPGLILAQAVGRWGNYFNQEAYGYQTDLPWAMFIDGAYRHPTFLYESIWDVLGCLLLVLVWYRWQRRRTGDVAACYLIYYSVGRFFIEHFRTDSLMLGPLQMAQVISIIGVLAGLALFLYNRRCPAPQHNDEGRPRR